MTDETSGGEAQQPLTAEQEEFLRQQAAAHAANAPSPAGDQAATAAQMTERGPLLPAEEQMDQLMAAFKAQSEQIAQLQAQLGTMQKQQEEALASQGGPLVSRYAQGVADKVTALIAAHPDAPQNHFAPVADAAAQLVDSAKTMAKSGGVLEDVQNAAAAVEKFATRTHWKSWGKHIDWSAILDDAETAAEEALKLAA